MNNERGFSLAEVMIAMVILTVGVLGIAASSAAVTRMSTEGGTSGGAAAVATSRIEALNATPCATMPSTGSATTGRFSESWRVTATGLLREIEVQVSYSTGRKTRTSTYVAYISCAPKAT